MDTFEEQIKEIYDKALLEIDALLEERKKLVEEKNTITRNYIKELNEKKAQDLLVSMKSNQ